MKRALDAFVPVLVNGHHDLLDQRGRRRDVETPPELNHAIDERPRGATRPLAEFIPDGDESWVSVLRLTETRDEVEVEARPRDGDDAPLVRVAAGQGVRHHVRRAGLVFDREVEAQQFPHPVVLGNCGEALIQQVLEAVMIRLDEEAAVPEIRPPVPDGVDETNELPFIGGKGAMARCDGSAEERDSTRPNRGTHALPVPSEEPASRGWPAP